MLAKSDNDPAFTVEEAVSPDICHTNKRETPYVILYKNTALEKLKNK